MSKSRFLTPEAVDRPSWRLSLPLCAICVIIWGVLRLLVFHEIVLPLTYALPLLICVWSRDPRQLWGMALIFAGMATIKMFIILPGGGLPGSYGWAVYAAQLLNITIGASVVHAIIRLRGRLERKNAEVEAANDEISRQNEQLERTNQELEASNEELAAREEELSQQHEELQVQSEELAQQNEELRGQAEELERQAEELRNQSEELAAINAELVQREQLLQGLLEVGSMFTSEGQVLDAVCRHGLRLLGPDVIGAAVMELRGEALHLRSQVGLTEYPAGEASWPLRRSLSQLVIQERRTASLDDLSLRPDLAFPRPADGVPLRSALATPLRMGSRVIGAIEFYASEPHSWTEDQFRLAEWLASQGTAALQAVRLQAALRESQEFTRRVLDNLFVFVGVLEADGTLIDVNAAPLTVAGIAEDDVRGRKFWECAWWTHAPQVVEQIRDACCRAASGETIRLDVPIRTAGDGRMMIDFQMRPLRDAEGRITHLVPSAVDISERTRAEEAMRASNRRLDLLAQTAGELLRSETPQRIVESLCRRVMAHLDCQAFFNFLLDVPEGRLRLNACGGIPDEEARRIEWLDLGGAVCGCAARDNCRIVSEDIQNTPDPRTELVRSYGITAYACHPLVAQDRVLGTLSFGTRTRRRFTEDDLSVMKAVADQVAIAMQRQQDAGALRESEERFRTMADGLPLIVWVHDARGEQQFVNHTFCHFFGVTEQEMRGGRWHMLLHPDDGEAYRREFAACVHDRRPFHAETRVRRADGQWRWFESWAQPRISPSGEFLGMVGSSADITARREAEEQLRRSEERFRTLADNMSQLAWMAEPDGSVFWHNRRWHDYTGISPAEAAGDGWLAPHHPDHLETTMQKMRQHVASGEAWEDTFPLRGRDGEYRWFLSRAVPIRDEAGKVLRWFGTHTDVTDQRRAQEELTAAKEAAEVASRAKDRFLAVLSHELRTPLNPALMAATIVDRDPLLPAHLREDVGVIRRNVELEARLIDDMLDLTRITRGKLSLNRQVIDACDVIRHAVRICHAEATDKGIALELGLPAEPVFVNGDPARLQQVFWNLLKNSIKFTDAGGKAIISAARDDRGCLRVEVRDTGKGIERELLAVIFDAFEQGGPQITKQFGGLGLGLAICKGLVELHDGQIQAFSDGPGKGACFVIDLPTVSALEARPDDGVGMVSAGAAVSDGTGAQRILLVEDHDSTARITARLLRGFGHTVEVAGSVASAVELFEQGSFDLVISDLGLPDGSGRDLLQMLLTRHPVRAIALSGYGMDSDIRESMAAGFVEHLVKPINARQLEEAIRRVACQQAPVARVQQEGTAAG